jgi:hypothetical protein
MTTEAKTVEPELPDNVFEIPARNYGYFLDRHAKLSRRSKRLRGEPLKLEVSEVYDKVVGKTNKGRLIVEPYYRVVVEAEPVKVGGYVFVATVDHTKDAGNIVRTMPGVEIPVPEVYRTAKPFCVHCNSMRMRRDTFLLCEEATGEIVQIGKNCLADFIGRDPRSIAALATYVDQLRGIADSDEVVFGMRDDCTIDLKTFLAHVAVMIRLYGWISATAAKQDHDDSVVATRTRAIENMFPRKNRDGEYDPEPEPIEDGDRELAETALAWALSLEGQGKLSDYHHNLLVIAKSAQIDHRSIGIAASIISSYLNSQELLKRREFVDTSNSQHVGEVGKRLDFGVVQVRSTWSGHVGDFFRYRYTFATEDGNVLEWLSSNGFELIKGEKVKLVGTVKEHGEYNGTKRTSLSRCKLAELDA